jgi:hypothetical protein
VREPRQEGDEIAAAQVVAAGQVLHGHALVEGDRREPEVREVPQPRCVAGPDRRPERGEQPRVGEVPQAPVKARPAPQAGQPLHDALWQERQAREQEQQATVARALLQPGRRVLGVAPARPHRYGYRSSSPAAAAASASPGVTLAGGSAPSATSSRNVAWCASPRRDRA